MDIGRRITKLEDYRGRRATRSALVGFIFVDADGTERAEVLVSETGEALAMGAFDARYPAAAPYAVLHNVNPDHI